MKAFLSALVLITTSVSVLYSQQTAAHPKWPGPGQLFAGTCYQPIDRSPEEIDRDIAIMGQRDPAAECDII